MTHRAQTGMQTYVSMLRGINVSGQKPIKMPALKAAYESLGFPRVETYIQSGNVIFESPKADAAALAAAIEGAIAASFGYTLSVIIRRADEMGTVIEACPFTAGSGSDPGQLYVTFLASMPPPDLVKQLRARMVTTTDECVITGRDVYVCCRNGYGKTQLSNTFFEKHLNVPATTRNWKTVTTLFAMTMSAPPPTT